MADQELRIRVAAETGAAQDALGKLSDEMAGLAKATEREGSEQQKLARQTAQTTAQVQAAREAVERAKRAQSEATAVTQAFGKDSREAAEAQQRLKVAQDAATKAARDAERALKASADAVSEAGKAADAKAAPAVKRMGEALVRAGKEADRLAGDLRQLDARMADVSAGAGRMGAAWASFKGNLAATAVTTLAGGLKDLGAHAIGTAAQYEQLQTALTTTLGSTEAATAQFAKLQQFAAATPFSLQEVTSSFVKLKNQGLDASARSMTALGDITSAMGKSLDDITEAALDAAQGEGERLKEFGIRMSKHGDNVALTFRGATKTIRADSREIQKYLVELGEANFAGGMEAQSRTLAGLWSTMKDGIDQLLVTIVNSGISDALKSMMGSFSGMGETATLLVDVLGTVLGGAFQVLAGAVSVATTAVEGFAWMANAATAPVKALAAEVSDLSERTLAEHKTRIEEINAIGISYADQMRQQEAETRARNAAEAEYVRGTGKDIRDLTEEQLFTMREVGQVAVERLRTGEQERGWLLNMVDLTGQHAMAIAEVGLAHLAAANAAERRKVAEDALWEKLQKRQDKAEQQAIEEAFFAEQEMGPKLAPGFKRPDDKAAKSAAKKAKSAAKKAADLRKAQFDFGSSVDEHAFKTTQSVREAEAEAAARAFEQEQALRERRIAGMSEEIAALDARAERERASVDMIFAAVEVESQAALAREALVDAQIEREADLARWEMQNAKTREQRERAQTRVFEVEAKKRATALAREVATEEREHKRRQQVVERVTGAVTTLGEGMVDALERAAAGERGAMAQMLADLLKGVAKKHAILALGEVAQGVAATAMTFGIPNPKAAAHFAAAGLHTGVAIAAGVGAYAAGQVADARQGGGGGGGGAPSPFGRPSGGGGSAGRGGSGGSGGSGDDGLEAQEVPISHEQLRRGSPRSGGGATAAQVVISGTVNIYGAGGKQEFVDDIRRALDRQDRAGRRARN